MAWETLTTDSPSKGYKHGCSSRRRREGRPDLDQDAEGGSSRGREGLVGRRVPLNAEGVSKVLHEKDGAKKLKDGMAAALGVGRGK
jgi:hypothetical protein